MNATLTLKRTTGGETAAWNKAHTGMVALYAVHFILGGGLAVIFFMQNALISVGISGGLLVLLVGSGAIAIVKRHPHFFYWYMSFCIIWIGWGLYHILWILGITSLPVADQVSWIGTTLAQKNGKNLAAVSGSVGTRVPGIATVAGTALPTQTRPIGAQGVVSRRPAATIPVATNLVRKDFVEKVYADVGMWRRSRDNSFSALEVKNDEFKAYDMPSRLHQLHARQIVQTIAPSRSSAVNTNDPMATTILPAVYSAHLLFLVVGFACVLLLPLISDDRRAIDEDNPWGNMTAEEIATQHLKNNEKKKRATSIFQRMTYRDPEPQNKYPPAESDQNTLNNPVNSLNRPQGFDSFKKPQKGGEAYKMNEYNSNKDPYGQQYDKQPNNYGGGYNNGYDNNNRDTYYQSPALSPNGSKNKRDPGYDNRETYYPQNNVAPGYNDRDTYYQPPPALSPKGSKNKQYDDRDPYYQGSGQNGPGYNDRDTYYQPPPAQPPLEIVRMKCTREYRPQLEDEVELLVNDLVDVEEQFEDGWGVGTNVATNEFGAFPLSCLSREVIDDQRRSIFIPADKGKKQRAQSLYGAKNAVDSRKKMGKETNKPGTGRPRDTMYNDYDESLDRGYKR